ncbi:hypothetical protein COLO4_29391 [Corchorus olitorius]|uniref:Uncharacterized protein n=1 Tax=Corchorus olitorius TaxID=93759 RepID=A0A1R3HEQ9_9ROSI|nr:hypothetical protein COLO4_29391 [Corchorus olitorius]
MSSPRCGVFPLAIAQILEQGFSIQRYKPEDSSPRSFTKSSAAANHGLVGSRSVATGRGDQGMPSSSFLTLGRQGAFRDHVDSMLLWWRPVARAIMPLEKSCEIISQFMAKPLEQKSGDEVTSKRGGKLALIRGDDAEFHGGGRVGRKGTNVILQKQSQELVEGGVGPTLIGVYPHNLNQTELGPLLLLHLWWDRRHQGVLAKSVRIGSLGAVDRVRQEGMDDGGRKGGEDFISIGIDHNSAIARSSKLAAAALEAG